MKVSPDMEKLLASLDKQIRAAFLLAIERLGDEIDVEEIASLLRAGRVTEALDVVNVRLLIAGFRPVGNRVSQSIIFAAQQNMEAAQNIAGLNVVFDVVETEASEYIRRSEFNLIRELSTQALGSVRAAILDGQAAGRNPLDTARDVRRFIGLTESQTKAVLNYRRSLENSSRDALVRELRDRRFDSSVRSAIENNKPLPKKKINQLVNRYAERYLVYRSRVIARTEALRAANGGAHLAWEQQVNEGRVSGNAISRRWVHTHDNRVRSSHRAIPILNKDGVSLTQPFRSPLGPILYPGDPNASAENTIQCRCTLIFNVDQSELV